MNTLRNMVLNFKEGQYLAAAVPLASGYASVRILPDHNSVLTFLLGMIAGGYMAPPPPLQSLGPVQKGHQLDREATTMTYAGPLSNQALRPGRADYQEHPPVPRYPLGTSTFYALHNDLGWAGARRATLQAEFTA